MTGIIIIGDGRDRTVERLLTGTLSETYEITYIRKDSIIRRGSGYRLLCAELSEPKIEGIKNPLILAKKDAVIPSKLPRDSIAVINADSAMQLSAIEKSRINAVTCGLSPTATISFSSESDNMLVVSLNRSLTALSGRVIQPLEIPIRKTADSYTLMSITALRLLLDDFDSELGRLM